IHLVRRAGAVNFEYENITLRDARFLLSRNTLSFPSFEPSNPLRPSLLQSLSWVYSTFRPPPSETRSPAVVIGACMSNLIRSRKAVSAAQNSPPPAQPSTAIAPAEMDHLPVGPRVSDAPVSSASSVA
ncbi:unnamed protein product, partial [Prunus brigantina]